MKEIKLDKKKLKMMSKNLVDNLPVFVEINQSYKLLFISSCLLDQKKKFYEKTKHTLAG